MELLDQLMYMVQVILAAVFVAFVYLAVDWFINR